MSLKIRAVKVLIKTADKTFGSQFNFDPSKLNIIRAENTKGKSTIFNSILYALGMEILIGTSKSRHSPLTYVLTRTIEHGDSELAIEESYVLLEVENKQGVIKTIKRTITPPRNRNLMEVLDGPCVTSQVHKPSSIEHYYVHGAGSAQNKKGFYNWLEKFLGWNLPNVQRFNGPDISLYLECIFPLFVVEQKRGWTQIQSGVPTQYGIKDVKKKALEFVLSLDIEKIEAKKREIRKLMAINANEWTKSVRSVEALAKSLNGVVENIPKDPKIDFESDIKPILKVNDSGKWILLSDMLEKLRRDLKTTQDSISENNSEKKNESHSSELESLQRDLFRTEAYERSLLKDFSTTATELELLDRRIEVLNDDIRKMEDAFKISRLGGKVDIASDLHNCPVCSSTVDGSALPQDVQRHLMNLDENLDFLKEERKAVEFLKTQNALNQDIRAKEIAAVRKSTSEFRDKIRMLKKSLVEDDRLPSVAILQQKLELENRLSRYVGIEEEFGVELQNLDELSTEYGSLKKKLDQIPEGFSEGDGEKIVQLRDTLREYLNNFGFSSFDPKYLEISDETLHPIVSDFDWYFEASGSDNIRAIWAFTLGLLSVSQSFSTNHIGLVMYDEPGQHSAKENSLKAFFSKAATLCGAGAQVIITTSEPIKNLEGHLAGVPAEKFFFQDGVKLISEIN